MVSTTRLSHIFNTSDALAVPTGERLVEGIGLL
jgi:hypothetical protein